MPVPAFVSPPGPKIRPLNVESVAWVAERKAVLCVFFMLLAIWAYGWYARKPNFGRYFWVLLFFALALMSKNPNLVKRPILVKGREIVLGFDEEAIAGLV